MPNTFVDGQVAYAADVNANFQYLLSLHGSARYVRANGTIIGAAIVPNLLQEQGVLVVSTTGGKLPQFYLTRNGRIFNAAGLVGYTSGGCAGTPYYSIQLLTAGTYSDYFVSAPQKPLPVDVNGALYYVPTDTSTTYSISVLSYRNIDGSCASASLSAYGYALLPNDSSVTGVSTYPFPTPITIDGVTLLPTTP